MLKSFVFINIMYIFAETFKLYNMKTLHNTFNPNYVPTQIENEYVPKGNHINDAIRKQFFTTFDVQRLNRIREIKLNNLNEKR
jgi:hypothetical protein